MGNFYISFRTRTWKLSRIVNGKIFCIQCLDTLFVLNYLRWWFWRKMWTEMLRLHLYFIYSKYVMFIYPIKFPLSALAISLVDVIFWRHILLSVLWMASRKSIAARNVSLRWPIYIFNLVDITKLYLLALSCFSRRRFVMFWLPVVVSNWHELWRHCWPLTLFLQNPKTLFSSSCGCVGICGVLMSCRLCRYIWGINEMWAV